MGAWGTEDFENDDAADWIAELEEAQAVAALLGKPAKTLPKALEQRLGAT